MAMIDEIITKVKLGAKLEDAIPAGADLEYWRRQVERKLAGEKPKRKVKRSGSRKASKRTFQASSVLSRNIQVAGAMAEQLDRINGQVEARVILWGEAW